MKQTVYVNRSSWLPLLGTLFISGGLLAILFLTFAGGTPILQAAPTGIWYVNVASGDDDNDCLSSGTACQTIKATIEKAADDDTIIIAAGTYLEHNITTYKRLMLQGAGADQTIIDGNHAGRVLYTSQDMTISGVTIRHGQILTPSAIIFDTGGAAIMTLGSLTLRDTVILSNTAIGSGGAIFNNGQLVIEGSELISNTSGGNGGAIFNYNLGGITITNTLIANNSAVGSLGGGIYTLQPLHMTAVTIRDNRSSSFGGGLVTEDQVILEAVTLQGNQSSVGAALFASNGSITFTNVTVSDNTADNNYGGVYISGPSTSLNLSNSTIANNRRTNAASNGFNGLIIGNNATVNIVNTIFADNDENNCGGTNGNWTSEGYNLSSDYSCAFTQTGDQQGTDPLLGALAEYGGGIQTHALLPGSPAIDTGTNTACPPVDQRGISRPYDGDNDATATCDKGSFEARHQIIIEDVTVAEGDIGTTSAVFTVTLSPASDQTVTVDYQTADGTALSGNDYTTVSNTLTFNPGETTKFITVLVSGDLDDESDETFTLHLSDAANADIIDPLATGTIVDDDGLPALTIADQSALEGNSGTTNATFLVSLSPSSPDTVSVYYESEDDTAVGGADYTAISGTLTFDPGQTSKEIVVPVLGDDVDEGVSEKFIVRLSTPLNAKIVDDHADGTITDDDTARLSQSHGPKVLEGNSGLTQATFTVNLSTPAAFIVSFDFEINPGYGDDGAKAGEDYIDVSGTIYFQPGETVQYYVVDIIGDTTPEEDEVFGSLISNANVPISVNGSLATILNDDNNDYKVYLPLVIK